MNKKEKDKEEYIALKRMFYYLLMCAVMAHLVNFIFFR